MRDCLALAPGGAVAAFWLDCAALADSARDAGALLALARRMGLGMTAEEATLADGALKALVAARGLGVVRAAASVEPDGEEARATVFASAGGSVK